ncbi:hypothetical protein ACFQ88_11395 [Paenibacillus sp. NPDC056579]|uniref:hypothetical protein n=1 Tax=unclassified Paenibacillus TaxID=185978 RepID=UPI001EF76FD6|nr:hypothetical protein [Paenibacillus sp. H1-7]ULL14869.1 hypothetical protein DVH26_10695 [Paenibacillus sp. H1-7]
MDWVFIGSTADDSFLLNGIDIFKKKWEDTGRKATVIDPIYKVKKYFTVWSVQSETDEVITFAAGEFSNCVWGIYTKD